MVFVRNSAARLAPPIAMSTARPFDAAIG